MGCLHKTVRYFLFINARNIAQSQMIAELGGMALFSWLTALPALAGSASTLLFGKLSDFIGRCTILLALMAVFGVGLAFSIQFTSMPILVVSIIAWIIFKFVENKAQALILDLQVLFNRTFITAAGAPLSFFRLVGTMAHSPIFVQNVINISPTSSGSMLTPSTTIAAFMGIPTGFVLAKTNKYRWMYNLGYPILFIALLAVWRFTTGAPIWVNVLVTFITGFGLCTIWTLNTLVGQFAIPKGLLGMAVGAIFFLQMVEIAVPSAILGMAQNSAPAPESDLLLVFLVGAVTMVMTLLILTIPEMSPDIE